MKGLFFSLEFTGVEASTNEQEQAQNEVVHQPKITDGRPSNS